MSREPDPAAEEVPIGIERDGHVAVVELRRPPHNFFDLRMISALADAFEALDADPECRAILLCAQGTSFCAGADFSKRDPDAAKRSARTTNPLYHEAVRLFESSKPVVGAIQGPAVGGGLGLALVPDFRVVAPEARFSANFARLGFHPGFGLSVTLPRLVGPQHAAMLMYTGRRVNAEEALRLGLADEVVPLAGLRERALELAREIATSSPLAVQSVRRTLRAGLADAIRLAVARESAIQAEQFGTEDFREGVAAMAARRPPVFKGR